MHFESFNAALGLDFQHLPRDLANVNARKSVFDPYIENNLILLKWNCSKIMHDVFFKASTNTLRMQLRLYWI